MIEANQTEDGVTTRNDWLIAVAADSRNLSLILSGDLNTNLVHEIEQFFVSYNETKGKRFELLGRFGPDSAIQLIKTAARKFHSKKSISK